MRFWVVVVKLVKFEWNIKTFFQEIKHLFKVKKSTHLLQYIKRRETRWISNLCIHFQIHWNQVLSNENHRASGTYCISCLLFQISESTWKIKRLQFYLPFSQVLLYCSNFIKNDFKIENCRSTFVSTLFDQQQQQKKKFHSIQFYDITGLIYRAILFHN